MAAEKPGEAVLRVLLDFGNAGPTTGTGVYGHGLLEGLRTHCAEIVDAQEAGISSVSTSLRPLRRLMYLSRLRRLRAKGYGGADVVHFTNVYAPRRQPGTATVVTIHDLDAILHPEVYTERYSVYYGRTVWSSIDRTQRITTDTDAVRTMILERYPAAAEKVQVVGVGLSRQFMEAADRQGASPAPATPTLLFVGRLEMKKNLEWLVNTVGEGIRKGAIPRLHLVLAGGRGYGFSRISGVMKRHAGITRWVESPSMDTLAGLYAGASAVVLPSRCEGFGIPLIEAMYCRKPVVASRIPTSLEVTGGAAYFFDLDDADGLFHALNEALVDRQREVHGPVAVRQLASYSWPLLARKAVEVYRDARSFA